MRRASNGGFLLKSCSVRNNIFVPRYYDPRIEEDLTALEDQFELFTIKALIERGFLEHDHGSYVPKMYYGTGPFPYIRTSDIANWELRASPKHGVASEVYDAYAPEQDVQPQDILFVHEGTYLIGTAAMVTAQDGPVLYQHHLAKFRVTERARFTPYYFLAALGSSIVQRQIRARQFSADVIDSVVGRLEEVIIPIAKSDATLGAISAVAEECVTERAELRSAISSFFPAFQLLLPKVDVGDLQTAIEHAGEAGGQTFLGDRENFVAFTKPSQSLVQDIFIPKYYNPKLVEDLHSFTVTCDLQPFSQLVQEGLVAISTGDEIGRLNYGGGTIPFVRTSDLGTYELKADSKHGVNDGVYQSHRGKQKVCAGDILLVRDGTYLVGSSSLVFEDDLPLIFCGGIYKLSFPKPEELPSGLVYALLNLPVVRRQLRSKQFTRDIIDTLGTRLLEVVLPVPRSLEFRQRASKFVVESCQKRVSARARLRELTNGLFVKAEVLEAA